MAFGKNENAVSSVIGVILMVAITVILAAIAAAFVFGMVGNVQKAKVVMATVMETGPLIAVTYHGGTDDGSLNYLTISVPGNATATTGPWYTDNANGGTTGPDGADNPGNGLTTTPVAAPVPANKPNMGAVYILIGKGTPGEDRIVVAGHFTDNAEQVIVDTIV